MKADIYLLKCLTNLHMGSGDVNYNVVDLEVERDPVTGEPTMNASGVKGAIRSHLELQYQNDAEKLEQIKKIFGSADNGGKQGTYRFFSGDLLARPLRVSKGDHPYVLAAMPSLIEGFYRKAAALGGADVLPGNEGMPIPGEGEILCSCSGIASVEGYPVTAVREKSPLMDKLLGEHWAAVHKDILQGMDLPVLAHNVLENGTSKNFWYTEYVPHESVFGLVILSPDGEENELEALLGENPVIQFGAEATTGCGYVQLTKVVGGA